MVVSLPIIAQAPQRMSYQAILRNSSNTLIANTIVGIRISILQGSSSGNTVYVENQTATTNVNGLVTLEIGGGTPVSGTFYSINWGASTYFIKTETDPIGGTNYTITGISQLLSVPYALYANSTGSSTNNTGFIHFIGELYGGGIVVSVWKDNQGIEHGLIASLADLTSTPTQNWSNLYPPLPVVISAVNTTNGQINTTSIINQSGHVSSAAKLCDDYTAGGFSDWYLPALFELGECNNVVFSINRILGDVNGFQLDVYWSSTEVSEYTAMSFDFFNGHNELYDKLSPARIRAVRRF